MSNGWASVRYFPFKAIVVFRSSKLYVQISIEFLSLSRSVPLEMVQVRNLGKPVELAGRYFNEGADEVSIIRPRSYPPISANDMITFSLTCYDTFASAWYSARSTIYCYWRFLLSCSYVPRY